MNPDHLSSYRQWAAQPHVQDFRKMLPVLIDAARQLPFKDRRAVVDALRPNDIRTLLEDTEMWLPLVCYYGDYSFRQSTEEIVIGVWSTVSQLAAGLFNSEARKAHAKKWMELGYPPKKGTK